MKLRLRQEPISEAVQNLKDALAANTDWEINYLDVKYLNDKAAEYRQRVKDYIKTYREWERSYRRERDIRGLIIKLEEGRMLMGHINNGLEMYNAVKNEARFLSKAYINQCRMPSHKARQQ